MGAGLREEAKSVRPILEDAEDAQVLCHAEEAPHLKFLRLGKDQEREEIDREVAHKVEEEVLPEIVGPDVLAPVVDLAVRDTDRKVAVAQEHVHVVEHIEEVVLCGLGGRGRLGCEDGRASRREATDATYYYDPWGGLGQRCFRIESDPEWDDDKVVDRDYEEPRVPKPGVCMW